MCYVYIICIIIIRKLLLGTDMMYFGAMCVCVCVCEMHQIYIHIQMNRHTLYTYKLNINT